MDLLDATKNKKRGVCDRKPEMFYHIYQSLMRVYFLRNVLSLFKPKNAYS